MNTKGTNIMLVVGDLIIDENCVAVRRVNKGEHIVSLTDDEVQTALGEQKIPIEWARFGQLHHSLKVDAFLNWQTLKAIHLHYGRQKWMSWENTGILTSLGNLAVLCWVKPETVIVQPSDSVDHPHPDAPPV